MESNIYILMNKPAGYVCSAVSDSHKTVFSLLSSELQLLVQKPKRGKKLHTVGRLDCDTTGLLLITDDGEFSHRLTNPESSIVKTYLVQLEKEVLEEDVKEYTKKFAEGVILPSEKKAEEQKSLPAQVDFLSSYTCLVKITEGKFHQIKRMFTAVGNKVFSLKRLSFGQYSLPVDLEEGQYKLFSPEN